jgi:hypothetical protein
MAILRSVSPPADASAARCQAVLGMQRGTAGGSACARPVYTSAITHHVVVERVALSTYGVPAMCYATASLLLRIIRSVYTICVYSVVYQV